MGLLPSRAVVFDHFVHRIHFFPRGMCRPAGPISRSCEEDKRLKLWGRLSVQPPSVRPLRAGCQLPRSSEPNACPQIAIYPIRELTTRRFQGFPTCLPAALPHCGSRLHLSAIFLERLAPVQSPCHLSGCRSRGIPTWLEYATIG